MPRRKVVPSLYRQSLKIFYNIVFDYCSYLALYRIPHKQQRLKLLHEYLVGYVPTSVLDDLLRLHNSYEHGYSSMKTYYFFRTVLHRRITYFKARNFQLEYSYWRKLFKTVFSNLVTLNLSLSCNDQILELIPPHCPNLEHLNATCKYERIETGQNACTFALSVTDYGLRALCHCKKLKTITVNEPRSNSRCVHNGITYAGLQRLLMWVQTLEDISYSDLGSVVSKGLESLSSLNLKIIRHYNATVDSIREILRLCKDLRELYLTFFNAESQNDIWFEVIKANLSLRALEVINLNCENNFNNLFQCLGESLAFLSISNNHSIITFENIVTIGKYCPNLTFLACGQVNNQHEIVCRPANMNQFSKLNNLHIHGNNIDVENILCFCTENATNLENLRVIEREYNNVNMDTVFPSSVPSNQLKHVETSVKLRFTTEGIRALLNKYPALNYLNVACFDDCQELQQEIKENNYDLVFINKIYSMPMRIADL